LGCQAQVVDSEERPKGGAAPLPSFPFTFHSGILLSWFVDSILFVYFICRGLVIFFFVAWSGWVHELG
jgi:hypothetical protein